MELKRQLDLSNLKSLNSECYSYTKKSIDFKVLAHEEASKNGLSTETYNYYIQIFRDAHQKALETQEKIDRTIEEYKTSSQFIQE